jgi:hypothetical protein
MSHGFAFIGIYYHTPKNIAKETIVSNVQNGGRGYTISPTLKATFIDIYFLSEKEREPPLWLWWRATLRLLGKYIPITYIIH